MFQKLDFLPFIGPLLALLRSRKFLVAIISVALDVAIAYDPRLEAVRAELIIVCALVGSLLVGGIAYEDGKEKGAQG